MESVKYNPDLLDVLDVQDDEDTLSFRDFPILEPQSEAGDSCSDHDDRQDFFEFRTDLKRKTSSLLPPSEIVFCGRTLDIFRDEDSASSRNRSESSLIRNQSFRYGNGSRPFSSSAVGGLFEIQRSNSRRPMALIGLTKTPSRIELSEIRKRQARLAPTPMFHVVPKETTVSVVTADGYESGISPWRLIKPLRYRSVVVRVLAKAASTCMSLV
uniref:Uncharacterized protein n=1 Tax=Cucumis sativus TaxID=3659 RepID=A0A0A0KNN4_CUCSA